MTWVALTPGLGEVDGLIETLASWQRDDGPLQLHPGDVGWFWRFGPSATLRALTAWKKDEDVVAIGLHDGPTVLRVALRPDAHLDRAIAERIVDDLTDESRGVLGAGEAFVEAPSGSELGHHLEARGWVRDEHWTPLQRDLGPEVEESTIRVVVVSEEWAAARVGVQRAAFARSTFTTDAWSEMCGGPAYQRAWCLLGFSLDGEPVAAATVWSAGEGRPGLLEPVGVARDHQGRGYGRAISVAAAAHLRAMGSSSAQVCTRSANVAAVATYRSAGFVPAEPRRDLRRA